ncbi:MAG: T9SS type A sorting domain-containing protein, partial [Gemmatimonadetes bacterium]|nr:T9SS type A sorting domain-containing protein [Gemmatimonadota bacterium]
VTNGQTVAVTLLGSDLRGDPTSALANSGRRLIAGDTSEDNEINEDDVNIIIAAWGTTTTVPSFHQADLNNDNQVGAADLTATTSNFGNSRGFGAPPVYKRAVVDANEGAAVEILPLFDVRQPLWVGREIELAVQVRDLDDLAGYEFDLHFDPQAMRLVADGSKEGDVFAANPLGAVFETRTDADGKIEVIGSRYGKQWSAAGSGALARLRFEILREDALQSVRTGQGVLLSSTYEREDLRWQGSLAQALLPLRPDLEQNFPNPFNPSTSIPFALPSRAQVRLSVFNVLGQRVRTLLNSQIEAGYHRLAWDGRNDEGYQAGAGVYFYLLESGQFRQTRKMTLVK